MFSFLVRQRQTLCESLFKQQARYLPKRRRPQRNQAPQIEKPSLRDTVKKLNVLVHPDKFGQHPEMQSANEQSLSILQGFLSSIRTLEGQYPPAGNHTLRFYLRKSDGEFHQIVAPLRSTGGDCQKLIEVQLAKLFEQCGLPASFTWDSGFWEMGKAPDAPKAEQTTEFSTAAPEYNFHNPFKNKASQPKTDTQEGSTEEEGTPSEGPRGLDQWKDGVHKIEVDPEQKSRVQAELENDGHIVDLRQALEALDPLLEAVAAVQWIPEDDTRDKVIRNDVVDHLEENGWKIREAAQALWRGDRDMSVFESKVDPNSYALISRVLQHVKEFEAEQAPVRVDPAV